LASALSPGNLATLKKARQAVEVLGPIITSRANHGNVAEAADRLVSALGSAGFCDRLPQMAADVTTIERSYHDLYAETWERRRRAYDELISLLTGRPEWTELPPAAREEILSPVRARSGDGVAPEDIRTHPSIEQMETDILAVERLRQDATMKLEAL